MKKQYISPLTTIVTVNTELTLLAGSITETLKTETVDNTTQDFVQCARGVNVWGDDEEL